MKPEEVKNKMKAERTFMMVKPDGVSRGLTGEIIRRMEDRGLKVVAIKMVTPTQEHVDKHLPVDEAWIERLGGKTLKTFAEYGIDPKEAEGTDDPKEIGKKVRESLMSYLTDGPVVATVVEGIHAIDMVRKIVGDTLPVFADAGTVRGDYSVDSPAIANLEGRAIKNLVHASENPEEADNEISLWFTEDEIQSYTRAGYEVMYEK